MPRHLSAKGGHHYWEPSASLRRLGFKGRKLSDDPAIAAREAEDYNAEADRYRQALGRGAHDRPMPGTVAHLIGAYRASDDFLDLAATTKRRYGQCLERIAKSLGDARLAAVTPPVAQAYKRSLAATPFEANHVLRTMRLLFSFAIREGYFVGVNPAAKFRQLRTRPRQELWTKDEQARFLAAASPEMALAYLLGVHTAQRECDLLALPWSAWDGDCIRLRQTKTGRLLDIPAAPDLRAALEAAPRRAVVILTMASGRPWSADHFRHQFAATRARAGVSGKRFMDLRRTAIVRLAELGCTVPEIASISGHDIDYCQRIIDTYLPRTVELARRAISRIK